MLRGDPTAPPQRDVLKQMRPIQQRVRGVCHLGESVPSFIHKAELLRRREAWGKEGWPPPLCWVWLAFLPCGPLFLNKTWEQARGCSAERERTQASPDLLGKTLSGSWQARRCGPRGPLRVWLLSALSAGPAGRVSSPSAWRLPPAPAPLGSKHFHIRQPRRWAPRLQQ